MGDRDQPSSDDLIRQSKEALDSPGPAPAAADPPDVEEQAPATAEDLDEPYLTPEPARRSTHYPADSATMPDQEAPFGGSALAKVIGVVLLVAVAIFWVLLLIGIATDPVDAWYAVVGGVVLSVIPLALGVYALRRGFRR